MKRFLLAITLFLLCSGLLPYFNVSYAANTCSTTGQVCSSSSDCCNNATCGGGSFVGSSACGALQSSSCNGPGGPCTQGQSDCCNGDTCTNGTCQQSVCSTIGQPCQWLTGGQGAVSNCCGGLTCDAATHGHCAQGTGSPTPTPPNACPTDNGICKTVDTAVGKIDVSSPGAFVKIAFGVILSISGAIAIIIIIFSGYGLMFSQGDPEKIKNNQEQLVSAIVGLLFMIFSVTILHIIGYDVFRFPGF